MKAAAKGYFGKSLDRADPRPGRDPRRDPPVADQVRPRAQRRGGLPGRTSPRARSARTSSSSCPRTREIVQRRNHILDLMKTRSPLTGDKHTPAEYEAAKEEPVVLAPQVSANWKAPALRVAGPPPARPDALPGHARRLPRGRHRRLPASSPRSTGTMQQTAEKWVYAAARAPNAKDPTADPEQPQDPEGRPGLDPGPARPQHPQRARPRSPTTGPARSSPTSGRPATRPRATRSSSPSSTSWPTAGASPGRRSSRSTTSIGIDDKTLTASTMFMDVTTNFGGGFIPTQADKLERGPVRAPRGAPVLAEHPGHQGHASCSGLDHVYDADQGLRADLPEHGRARSLSMGIGTLEVHPIDLLGAYGTIANGGVLMPRRMIAPDRRRRAARRSGRRPTAPPKGTQVISPAGRLHHHRHPGRQHGHEGQPVLGQVGDLRRQDPPAGRLQDRHDERQPRRGRLRLLAPPADPNAPALAVGVWMGNSDNTPNDGQALARHVGAALVGDPDRGQQGRADRRRSRPPQGLETATVDAFTGLKPGPFTTKTVTELFIPGTVPTQKETLRGRGLDRRGERPAVAGRLRRAEGHQGLLQPLGGRGQLPGLAEGQRGVGARGRREGSGVRGGPKGTRTVVLLQRRVHAVRPDLGRAVRAERALPAGTAAAVCDPFAYPPDPFAPPPPCIPRPTDPAAAPTPKPFKHPDAALATPKPH